MTTTLLAFDMIAPMIGGVVLTGAFSFFGGILLGRKKPDDFENDLGVQRISGLEAEIQRLNRERASEQLEDQLVDEFFGPGDVELSVAAFLRRIVPLPSSSFAAVVGTGSDDGCPTMARGLSKQSIEQLKIPQELVRRLKIENPLMIERANDPAGLFHRFDEIDRMKAERLYLIGFDDGNDFLAILITPTLELPGMRPMNWGGHVLAEAEQRKFTKRIAGKVGNRWHQLRLVEQQSRELRSTRDMLELRGIIDSQSDEPIETLERFATRLGEMAQADRVAIYFVARRAGEKLQPIVQCGRPLPAGVDAAWHRQEQALAHIAIESELGSLHDGDWLRNLQTDSLIASAATVPIRVNGRVLGALCLTRQVEDESLERNRTLIEFGAETLSLSLRRVFEEATIRRQARHDHLTDLVNRRSFDAYLETEIERIQHQESAACSLILADLDRFKSYNDRFGHQGGDRVLRETARVLSEQVSRLRMGENSIVARYGGEEFAILLPNVGLAGARRIAEGIRAAIEATTVRVHNASLNITISLGVAECPHQATSAESLIAAADKALYQAKSDGRNRVCQAELVAD